MKVMVLLALLVTACTVERDVIVDHSLDCEVALRIGATGQSCQFTGGCQIPDPSDMRCTIEATCNGGVLTRTDLCESECTDDTACKLGFQICSDETCEPCPSTVGCAACPNGFLPLERNGCPSCDCGPPATCEAGFTSPTCTGSDACYAGADCASGCDSHDVGCCSDQCAAPGCKGPVPAGCLVVCPTQTSTACCGACITEHCTCDGTSWHCTAVCAKGAQSACVGPT